MSRSALVTVAALLALIAAPASFAKTSHAKLWSNSNDKVGCGIARPVPGKRATYLLCSSTKGIPRPKHGGPVGDPYVQIKSSGRPQLVLISHRRLQARTPIVISRDQGRVEAAVRRAALEA